MFTGYSFGSVLRLVGLVMMSLCGAVTGFMFVARIPQYYATHGGSHTCML